MYIIFYKKGWYDNLIWLYTGKKKPYNKITYFIKGAERMDEYMTGREIVNLINKLEAEGMSAEKIIEIIKYVETADPRETAAK